jgi:hypothetical protein
VGNHRPYRDRIVEPEMPAALTAKDFFDGSVSWFSVTEMPFLPPSFSLIDTERFKAMLQKNVSSEPQKREPSIGNGGGDSTPNGNPADVPSDPHGRPIY